MEEIVKKYGLLYSADLKCVLGIDSASDEFTGIVPNGAERIEEEAFSCCSVKNISLPDSVVSAGANLFCNSTELESVKLSKNLRTLSPYMFCGCKSLKKIEMPYEIDGFSEGLFAECTSLEEIPFRVGIKTLPEGVFDCCTSIRSLVIPDSVEKICSGAIAGCSSLTTIVLPASLKEIAADAIADCPVLSRIRISEENALFRTDEEGMQLFRKNDDGTETLVFEVPAKIQNDVPSVNESDSSDNPSIITFEDDDEVDAEGAEGTENSAGSETSDVDARLAEIMGQGNQFDDGEFSIMDIPAASEEEIEACCLNASGGETQNVQAEDEPAEEPSADECTGEGEVLEPENESASPLCETTAVDAVSAENEPAECSECQQSVPSMQEQVADIIKENTGVDSDMEISVQSEDEPSETPVQTQQGVARISDEKTAMNNLVFESEKVKQQVVSHDSGEEKILYVFAENLADTSIGKDFSPRLVNCCNRLAEIHKYTSIFYFYNVDIENTVFRAEFEAYIKNKDCVVACAASTLSTLSDRTVEFASCVGIRLEKDELLKQGENARNPSSGTLKLLVQDILS